MNTKSKSIVLLNIFVLFVCLFALIAQVWQPLSVHAEGEIKRYYYIVQNTIMITETSGIQGNLQLKSTYYVQATGNPDKTINDVTYRKVIYNGITGLVPTSALSKKSIDNISSPYFVSNNKLTIQTSGTHVLMFYNINDDDFEGRRLQNNTKLDFLAYSENGDYLLVKLADGIVGFVNESDCTPKVIFSPHPNPINPDNQPALPDLSPDGDNDVVPSKDNKATITRIILIVTLCVIVVVVIFLLFKPIGHKKTSKDDFYDF